METFTNQLPEFYTDSKDADAVTRVLNDFQEKGIEIHWGELGPYVLLGNGFKVHVNDAFEKEIDKSEIVEIKDSFQSTAWKYDLQKER